MNVDISCIAKENHGYAIHLATFQNIIAYKNGSYEIADVSFGRDPFDAVDFWPQILGIKIEGGIAIFIEGAVQHADDFR